MSNATVSFRPADVAVDEENGRVFGVGKIYDETIDSTGALHARAFNEAGETLWNFQEYGRNPLLVRPTALVIEPWKRHRCRCYCRRRIGSNFSPSTTGPLRTTRLSPTPFESIFCQGGDFVGSAFSSFFAAEYDQTTGFLIVVGENDGYVPTHGLAWVPTQTLQNLGVSSSTSVAAPGCVFPAAFDVVAGPFPPSSAARETFIG